MYIFYCLENNYTFLLKLNYIQNFVKLKMSLLLFFFFISPDFDNIIIRREKFTIEKNILILILIY